MIKIVLLFVSMFAFALPTFATTTLSCTFNKDSKQKVVKSFVASVVRLGGIIEREADSSASGSIGDMKVSVATIDKTPRVFEGVFTAVHPIFSHKESKQIENITQKMSDTDPEECGKYENRAD